MNEATNKSGLQQLVELSPALRASTERLRRHFDDLQKQQAQPAQPRVMNESSPWGKAVASFTRPKAEAS
jgi:predicted ArsR family transcriptional regulator